MLVKCLVDLLKNELAENFTPTMYFALAALKYQAYFHLQQFKAERVKRRPASSVVTSTTTRQQSLDGIQRRQRVSMPEIVAFNKHSHAATRIQAVFKGYYIVKLKRAYMLGMFSFGWDTFSLFQEFSVDLQIFVPVIIFFFTTLFAKIS